MLEYAAFSVRFTNMIWRNLIFNFHVERESSIKTNKQTEKTKSKALCTEWIGKGEEFIYWRIFGRKEQAKAPKPYSWLWYIKLIKVDYLSSRVTSERLLLLLVFVLMGWSLLPNALLPFKIYCDPPNLGITRTWICRLHLAQRPIFSALRFFNEPEISDSGFPA